MWLLFRLCLCVLWVKVVRRYMVMYVHAHSVHCVQWRTVCIIVLFFQLHFIVRWNSLTYYRLIRLISFHRKYCHVGHAVAAKLYVLRIRHTHTLCPIRYIPRLDDIPNMLKVFRTFFSFLKIVSWNETARVAATLGIDTRRIFVSGWSLLYLRRLESNNKQSPHNKLLIDCLISYM